jgi:hypothetical protein
MLCLFAGIVRESSILQKTRKYAANFFGGYGVRAMKPWKVGSGLCVVRVFIVCRAIGVKPITLYGQTNLAVKIGLREVVI